VNIPGRVGDHLALALQTLRSKAGARRVAQQQSRLASILESSAQAIIGVDLACTITDWNLGAQQICGYSQEEAVGQSCQLLFPKASEWDAASYLEMIAGGHRVNPFETAWITRSGRRLDIWLTITPLRCLEGKVVGAFLIASDITDRKHTERNLAQSEAQFRSLFENALDAVLIADDQARFVDANPAACSLLGGSRQQVVGSSLYDYMRPDRKESVAELWREFLETGSKRGLVRVYRLNGTSLVVDYSSTAHFAPGLNLTVLRDVSLQRQLEEQLRQSQKMEAVGQLAGGVAHDFNNLLMVILGYTEDARQQLQAEGPIGQCLEEIHLAASRAVALTEQLLTFSRKQIVQPRMMDLNTIVNEIQKMLERLIREDIHLQVRFASVPLWIRADPGQIQQLVVNLVVNARDAMPRGGQLQLQTQEVAVDPESAHQSPAVGPGRYALLTVSDSGEGMSKDIKNRIFEPFFTTKAVGQGTGLGLSTAFGIVTQAGGIISVDSEIGVGSVFKVHLPLAGQQSPPVHLPENDLGKSSPDPLAGSETILLVEDDESLRRLIPRIFQGSGYTLKVAGDGQSALKLAEQSAHPIDLLVTDVVMPGLSGLEVTEGVRALWPKIKVLFMSGYTPDSLVRQGMSGGMNFIQKPFSPADLKRQIRALLDQPDSDGG